MFQQICEFYRKKRILILLSIGLSCFSCSSSPIIDKDNYQFQKQTTYATSLQQLQRSTTSIDQGITMQLFFIITKKEKCTKISIKGRNTVPGKNTPLLVYYIVEKAIPTDIFKNAPQYTYSKLYQNYDENWRTSQEGFICSQKSDPIKHLDPGVYRILLTTFQSGDATLELVIFSDNTIEITPTFPTPIKLEKTIKKSTSNM